ncbi:MAG: chemotaxis protein CheC [Parcubacteria group bacterium Licking1014_1]|nr:MAG: chemotaxis protein CheC [Parcubacteria group bacterium Licking1014_1]
MQQITEEQLASLEIVAKASAERASETLSKLVGIPVKLAMARVRIMENAELAELIASPEKSVSAIFLPVTGEGKGSSVLISSIQESHRLAELITKQPKGSFAKLDDSAISILEETANIIGGAFLSELSNKTGVSFIQSVPSHSINTMQEVVDMAIGKLEHKDSKLAVAFEIDFSLTTTIITTTTTEKIITHYIFLLEVAFAQKLLEALKK